MKIVAIQHDAADPPAAAGEVVKELGHELETVCLDRGHAIPGDVCSDVLMTFGGGISLAKPDQPAWVAQEQSLIRKYVDQGAKVFGICAGAQIIAAALDATVRRNEHPEVGWQKLTVCDSAPDLIKDVFDDGSIVFHWHQDTFAIPEGATHVLSSQACQNQGYMLGNQVIGFQFHLEANEKTVRTFLAVSRIWKQDAPFVQTETEITNGIQHYLPDQTKKLEKLLRGFLDAT